jgi:hypothetical protein
MDSSPLYESQMVDRERMALAIPSIELVQEGWPEQSTDRRVGDLPFGEWFGLF